PEDRNTQEKGFNAIHNIFNSTGAREIVTGEITIGLHLMGGLGIGSDPSRSVVNPEFRLHGRNNIFCADSSIFPNAPGINPSLTIMALNKMAGEKILRSL
ncbi:MAG: GMC family oxidoreductase, partial [Deltaproteobacteria bacterium]